MSDRYARQMILQQVGTGGQIALQDAHVLIVGMGGLGCPAAQYLVAAGVGHVTLLDNDMVSRSNLHRQVLYREGDIGKPKVTAAAASLRTLNPECKITELRDALTPLNASELVGDATVVLDCADSFAVTYILSDTCRVAQMPLISASALGLSGYVGAFCAGAPSVRAVFPDLPDTSATCATAGVLGPVVGMLGSLQAQITLNLLLNITPSPMGRLVSFDFETLKQGGFAFLGAPEPDTIWPFIAASEITEADFVVELRSEATIPVTQTALRSTVTDFQNNPPLPQPGQRAVMVCRSGLRAWHAARGLQAVWDGQITLIAMGDMPTDSTGSN